MSSLEIVGVVVSAIAIWLTAHRKMACWPIGLASVVLYGWIFYDAKLYSDFLLQGGFAIAQIYGWVRWHQAGRARVGDGHRDGKSEVASEAVRIVKPSGRTLWLGLLLGVLGGVALGAIMAAKTDAALPYVDALLASFSLVAQYWTARRYIANWTLWSAVNVVYIGMFVFKHLYPTAGLYFLFLILAAIGWRDWRNAGEVSAGEDEQGTSYAERAGAYPQEAVK